MSASNLTLNPYRPIFLHDPSANRIEINSHAPLSVARVGKSMLYREIVLEGLFEATIAWDARGSCEFVRLNGKTVVSKLSWWFVPHFEFVIPTVDGNLLGQIDVDVAWLFLTRGFRLTLDHRIVYQEPASQPQRMRSILHRGAC